MVNMVLKIILALIYLFGGLGLFLSRRELEAGDKKPNLVVPAALLILAAITTPFL
jgi:hypothetical protein